MSKMTKEDIMKIVEEKDVKFIRLQFTDVLGRLKNVAITSSQLEKALDNKIMFDGSSIEGFVRIEESDMYLRPDPDTFAILPWRPKEDSVARMICDVYDPEGNPFMGDPRYCLKRALDEAEDMGFQFHVGPECEFFIFHTDEVGRPTTLTHDTSGYFDLGPMDLGGKIRREICLMLEKMGYEIETSHHEVAVGQHEVDFKYEEALKTADDIMTFKLAVKSVAQKMGTCAVFLPKPLQGQNGSGMHTNMSLTRDGENVFYDPKDPIKNGLSETAYQFIAGIMEHIPAITAIANPLVNSYKRLVAGYEAPVYVAWSCKNRSPLIRIPASRGSATRVELRSPDPTANPYLLLACCLRAGLDGIKKGLTPPASVDENIFAMSEKELEERGIGALPANLNEALHALGQDEIIKDILGPHIVENYILAKQKEWKEYCENVSEWEIQKYIKEY